MSQSRQLAAIMFTDIVGYTALMGKDSPKAMELMHVNKKLQPYGQTNLTRTLRVLSIFRLQFAT